MGVGEVTINALQACVGVGAIAYAISGVGLNLQFGFTGLLNLGHAGSMMMGAYGTAIFVEVTGFSDSNLWVRLPILGAGVLIGILAADIMGFILGLFTLKLRHEYLAIITIAFAEILRRVIRSKWGKENLETGGANGIQNFAEAFYNISPIPPNGHYGIGDFTFTGRQVWLFLWALPTLILIILLIRTLLNSPWGRVIKAIREDEEVARSLGKNVFLYKLQSLCIGGTIGAIAGILFAFERQNVTPDDFEPELTFYVYTIVILGGTSKIWGSVVGSIVFWFSLIWLEGIVKLAINENWLWVASVLKLNNAQGGVIRFILVGLTLILLLAFRPEGILGKKEGATANG